MRLLNIYSTPVEKQIYITNQLLNNGYGANTSATSTSQALVSGTALTILPVNPNRKSLTISNPSASILYITFGVIATSGSGTYIQPGTSFTFFPVSTAYVSAIVGANTTISITEL